MSHADPKTTLLTVLAKPFLATLTVVALTATALVLVGCAKDDAGGAADPAGVPVFAAPDAKEEGELGIPACDKFIRKFEKCLNETIPEAQRANVDAGIRWIIDSWKAGIDDPQTRAGLPDNCRQMDETQERVMRYYGCEW